MPRFKNNFASLPDAFYSRVNSSALKHPHWVIRNHQLASELGIDWQVDVNDRWLGAFSGAAPPSGSQPLAMVYAGHQFGQFVAQLGDGRGLLLGDLPIQGQPYELHLKGAGQTPYSRFGDGRAVLRSCIREYIGSEALHALGVPTTRALCITSGSDTVWRETQEPAAMLVRVAQSHVRFGSFEYFHYSGQHERVQALADYCIANYFPAITALQGAERYQAMLQLVVERTAILIAHWQAVGFAHGVMNTDNMSIIGDTFDFGPYGFLDEYDPAYICNHTDYHGRYAFNAQPQIGFWNVNALAHSLSSLLDQEGRETALARYEPTLIEKYEALMSAKLGLLEQQTGDSELIFEWLELLKTNGADYNLGFRRLGDALETGEDEHLRAQFSGSAVLFNTWLSKYRTRVSASEQGKMASVALMQRSNPIYIVRNHLAQEAIEQADNGIYAPLEQLLELVSNPYQEKQGCERFAMVAPAWSKQLEISCSS
ncbi:MAG: YdiU family protein [Gammaproteobacteria bacterium]|nr:YdiU family protein [Gammaproteobacteria bacterium]